MSLFFKMIISIQNLHRSMVRVAMVGAVGWFRGCVEIQFCMFLAAIAAKRDHVGLSIRSQEFQGVV